MSTISYAQWYNGATAEIARKAHARMMHPDGYGQRFWLYFKPRGLEFRVCAEGEDHDGFELVTPESLPGDRDLDGLIRLVHDLCRRVPVLPGD